MEGGATPEIRPEVELVAEFGLPGDHDVDGMDALFPGGVVDVDVVVPSVGIGTGPEEELDDVNVTTDGSGMKGRPAERVTRVDIDPLPQPVANFVEAPPVGGL